ncbi:heavy metal translocating P-type ATPase [Jutongia hominis]|uniref:Cd(2+)-exporting ATPase n=1 Tax=Jutongia hominis TaxID=2763664 RepID=A0ABR7MRF9_9FIRM|nr:heavy metal translocating P-type ATPase [Jutongia hominis]MBC8556384.1 cadmium-translocating P-type ATPase [Jutongia hominis]
MKKKYSITGIDCANCAAKLEAKMNELPEVESVTLSFTTQQLYVEAENPDETVKALQALADKVEPGTEIGSLKRGKRKAKAHSHEHHHHHDDDGDCCCGHDHKHEHHEHDHDDDGDCCCGHDHEHEHHEHHHDDDGDCCCGHDHEHEHHEHDHDDDGDCCCGHDHEHHRHHHDDDEDCCCGHDHEHHRHHHDDDEDSCCDHDHDHYYHHDDEEEEEEKTSFFAEHKDAIVLAIGAVLFVVAELVEKFANVQYLPESIFVIAYIILGAEIVLTAVKNLFGGKVFDENFLMSIATIGAFVVGDFAEAVGVMLFYRIGELFEDVAVNKSRKQIMEAVDMRPEMVRLYEEGKVIEVDPEDVKVGDCIEIRPGDRIPLDGTVLRGESRIDTSAVTGEPVPVAVAPGSEVLSGCVNTSGILYLQVDKLLEDSMVTRILEAVENAAASKPKMDRFITKFARIYTPFVVLAATATAIIPSIVTGDWAHWVYTALTFLIISCPCALVLSVPLAFFAGIGAGSKLGILFKGGVSLEMLADIKAVVMDKTGTITEGNFKVESVIPADAFTEEQIITWAGSAESASTHPIAVSIREAVKERKLTSEKPEDMKEISGEGIEVTLPEGKILCGNQKLLQRYQIAIPQNDLQECGTEVFVAKDSKYAGRIQINDLVKADSTEAIQRMKTLGLHTAMLTGDTEKNAKAVQETTGIDEVFARQMPEDKLKNLGALREKYGAVMFIGDGINDAPVLAGADVGAAMGSGADAAIEAADVVFMTSRLSALNESYNIARKTKKIAYENVVFALAVKVAVMVLGLCGIASMWMAVFADSGVAMLCVLNSIRVLYAKSLK